MTFDLRPWLEELRQAGELVEVAGASVELEIGAITDINAKLRGPALLFTGIPGFDSAGRVLTCSLSRSARLALALGFDPPQDDHAMVAALRGKPAIWLTGAVDYPPTVVDSGPVYESVVVQDELRLTALPAPLWHEGDGGRYLGTGCAVITRDPDSHEINVGTYRVVINDDRSLGLFIEPIHHGSIHIQKHHENGLPAPIAVSFGHSPLIHLASSMPMPYGVSELNYAGAMAGESVPVVIGEVTGLPIPASSELAIEGFVFPDDLEFEGPFGEFTGYFAGGRALRPVIRVERMYSRDDPIIYGSLPAKPPFDHSYWRSAIESSMLFDRLRLSGVPDVQAVWKHESGCSQFWVVIAIHQRYAGHAQQAATVAAMAAEGASMGRYVIVVDEDVDVTDIEEVIWAISTRTNPATSIQFLRGVPTNPLDPMLLDLDEPWVTSRAVIDACRPFGRRADFPQVVSVSRALRDSVTSRFGSLLGWPLPDGERSPALDGAGDGAEPPRDQADIS